MDLPIRPDWHHLSVLSRNLDYCLVISCTVELVLSAESPVNEWNLGENVFL